MSKISRLLIVGLGLVAAVISAPARAQITGGTFEFGSLLSGSYQPSATFATLSVTQIDSNSYSFVLTTNDLNALFTTNAFIGSLAFNAVPNPPSGSSGLPTVSGVTVPPDQVGSVGRSSGGGPTGSYDQRFTFGSGTDRLRANETVSWTADWPTGVSTLGFADDPFGTGSNAFALHVQGLTTAQGGSAWYTPPIPEPEIYAMMLAGLGLMGFVAGRRRQQTAAA